MIFAYESAQIIKSISNWYVSLDFRGLTNFSTYHWMMLESLKLTKTGLGYQILIFKLL